MGTASGRDITTRAPPVPVPQVVWVFSHAWVILNLCIAVDVGCVMSKERAFTQGEVEEIKRGRREDEGRTVIRH